MAYLSKCSSSVGLTFFIDCLAIDFAWKSNQGIGVDVHVHRISHRLNWLPYDTKAPEQTRLALESWIPR